MTQPAVSRAISALESELGVTLMIRDRKSGVILTDIGLRLLAIFRDILHGYNKVEQEVTAEKGFEVGTVRVGAFPIVTEHFLPKILQVITWSLQVFCNTHVYIRQQPVSGDKNFISLIAA